MRAFVDDTSTELFYELTNGPATVGELAEWHDLSVQEVQIKLRRFAALGLVEAETQEPDAQLRIGSRVEVVEADGRITAKMPSDGGCRLDLTFPEHWSP